MYPRKTHQPTLVSPSELPHLSFSFSTVSRPLSLPFKFVALFFYRVSDQTNSIIIVLVAVEFDQINPVLYTMASDTSSSYVSSSDDAVSAAGVEVQSLSLCGVSIIKAIGVGFGFPNKGIRMNELGKRHAFDKLFS